MLTVKVGAAHTWCGNMLELTETNYSEFLNVLIAVNSGKQVKLSDFEFVDYANNNQLTIHQSKCFTQTETLHAGIKHEYLIVELYYNKVNHISSNIDITDFKNHISNKFPKLYESALTKALLNLEVVLGLFTDSLNLLLAFENGVLGYISSFPKDNLKNIEQFISGDQLVALKEANPISKLPVRSQLGGYYFRINPAPIFVNRGYLELGSLVLDDSKPGEVHLVMAYINTLRTYANSVMLRKAINMILQEAILNLDTDEATQKAESYKAYWVRLGRLLYGMYNDRNSDSYYGLPESKVDFSPVICNVITAVEPIQQTSFILSDKDKEFLQTLKALDKATIYNKHKKISATPVRNCEIIKSHHGCIQVFTKSSKKEKSDESAYYTRVYRDFQSFVVSAAAIPLFQKDFVIPDSLKENYSFEMANLDQAWFRPRGCDPRAHSNYKDFILNTYVCNVDKAAIPEEKSAVESQVKMFIMALKGKGIKTATGSNPSIFSKYFIYPLIETNGLYSSLETPSIFGWMYGMDIQKNLGWSYTKTSAHFIRSIGRGYFNHTSGLVSNKTLGVLNILSHVFVKTPGNAKAFSGDSRFDLLNNSVNKEKIYSELYDIYCANFIPNKVVEDWAQNNGTSNQNNNIYNLTVNLNQLIFLSAESLSILNELYSCENYSQLSTALNKHMPALLETLGSLDIHPTLKKHISCLLTYVNSTTTAVAKELNSDEPEKLSLG